MSGRHSGTVGVGVGGVAKTDASAALGIIERQGLGKVRHVGTALLYVHKVLV